MKKTKLRVVMRGVSMSTDVKEVCDDLEAQGIAVINTHRMYSTRKPKTQLPLFLVKAKRDGKRFIR